MESIDGESEQSTTFMLLDLSEDENDDHLYDDKGRHMLQEISEDESEDVTDDDDDDGGDGGDGDDELDEDNEECF